MEHFGGKVGKQHFNLFGVKHDATTTMYFECSKTYNNFFMALRYYQYSDDWEDWNPSGRLGIPCNP